MSLKMQKKTLIQSVAVVTALLVATVLLAGRDGTMTVNPAKSCSAVKAQCGATCQKTACTGEKKAGCPADCKKACCEAKIKAGTCPKTQGDKACPSKCPKTACTAEKKTGCPAGCTKPCCAAKTEKTGCKSTCGATK